MTGSGLVERQGAADRRQIEQGGGLLLGGLAAPVVALGGGRASVAGRALLTQLHEAVRKQNQGFGELPAKHCPIVAVRRAKLGSVPAHSRAWLQRGVATGAL
jgi:hypothetical protein